MADPTPRVRPNPRFAWGRSRKEKATTVVDIDIALREIVFERRVAQTHAGFDDDWRTSPDYAMEGVLLHATPPRGDDPEAGPMMVYVCGYEQSERLDRDQDFDPRSICYIATDQREDFAWHANIYIEKFLFCRLVELYASKRIDFLRMSVLLNVLRDSAGVIDVPTFPALRTAGGASSQSRSQLLCVLTSQSHGPHGHAAITRQSKHPAAQLGQRLEAVFAG